MDQLILADIEKRVSGLEVELRDVIRRNARVEEDKAWETSTARVLIISGLTYFVCAVVLFVIGVESYLLSALIPMVGFFLSTRTIVIAKKSWLSRR